MLTQTLNFTLYKGVSFAKTLTVADGDGGVEDLTDFTVRGIAKKRFNSTVSIDLSPEISDVPESGNIFLSMTAETTAALEEDRYIYSVVLDTGEDGTALVFEGVITVLGNPTQPATTTTTTAAP